MNKSQKVFEALKAGRLIGLISPSRPEDCLRAYEALQPAGVILEVGLRSGVALDGLKAILDRHPGALLLAGTVMTRQQAREAISAGAAGIVSADFIPGVVEACVEADVMAVPGGLSDAGKQLALKAELYGCDFLELRAKRPYQWIYKLFPAFAGSQSHIGLASAWRGPYKDLTVVYAGGVNLNNLAQVVAVDPEGILCASALTKRIEEAEAMRRDAEAWLAVLKPARKTGS